ncbi:insulinase family protein [Candidatus Dependentiae bacterium]|nr:insulinase family protein [Candidatus Dependentiae bacterium]
MYRPIFKSLKNGLNVIVVEKKDIPKVSVQLWYNVGSKDEKSSEKGIAHLIEHMIFKGTKKLSESDINLITHKLSGSTNAFTSYDYTGYLFELPSQHWQEVMPIMADCMKNCTFKEQHLNSELKAVIQELKMYKDDYSTSLIEILMSQIFPDHPYHHPIIGYKQDLWNLNRENLVNFYQKHYNPSNATLIVVGDVDAEEVFKSAQENFGPIEPNLDYKKDEYYAGKEICSKSVTLYKDIQQPFVLLCWVIDGLSAGNDYLWDILNWALVRGKGSRLHRELIDEKQLITEVDGLMYDLFEHGLYMLHFQPKDVNKIDEIIEIINKNIQDIAQNGLKEEEIQRAIKKSKVVYLDDLEDTQKQAYALGKYYLALNNINYFYDYPNLLEKKENGDQIQELVAKYLRSTLMHKGTVLQLPESEKQYALELQELSDQEDEKILKGKTRQAEIEEGVHVNLIEAKEPKTFDYPEYNTIVLDNGLKVIYYPKNNLPKIDLILDLKAKYFYDPEDIQGLGNFVSQMLLEGTINYNCQELAKEIESHGMTIITAPGQVVMSMLSSDLEKGMQILTDILKNSVLSVESLEKLKHRVISEIKTFWDNPGQFAGQLIKGKIYQGHPYSKNILGLIDTISKIKRDDLISYFKKFVTPESATLSIVGNFTDSQLKNVLQKTLNTWMGSKISDIVFPALKDIQYEEINHHIVRDQTVLAYAGLSVKRLDPDYDKLLLFDQIFGGGLLGSMSSRLFDLRERSGLFYTISGSLINRPDKQPGLVYIKTIVSNDRLKEAEKSIENLIGTVIETIEPAELEEAKRVVINSLSDNFSSYRAIANSILFLENYGLNIDYLKNRASDLAKIDLEDVQTTAAKFLNTEKLKKFRIGRI